MRKGEPAHRFPFGFSRIVRTRAGEQVTGWFDRPAGLFGGLCRNDGNEHLRIRTGSERDLTVDERIDGGGLAQADARAGMPLGAALAHDDVAAHDFLAAELLDAKTTASGI